MPLSPKLQLKQSQSLVMTPQLMQSIRLLQLTRAELEQFIDEEIERNPLIQRAEDDSEPVQPQAAAQASKKENGEALDVPHDFSGDLDAPSENIFQSENLGSEPLSNGVAEHWRSFHRGAEASEFNYEDVTAAPVTFRDHIEEQIAFSRFTAEERGIALELADWVDEIGYMRGDLPEIADRLNCPQQSVEAVLTRCQSFEPPGIFARDLSQCLAIQCARRNRLDPAMEKLLANLTLLAKRDFDNLRRICGVDNEDLLDMLEEIRSLDPKPGTIFAAGFCEFAVPDVKVTARGDGGWDVELHPASMPRVLLDRTYYATVNARVSEKEKEFLADCLQSANWLMRSLDQRAKTILKVASEIVRQQDSFLLHGVQHLRPLNLKTVAAAIGMHESTVSRVTANKFMATPRGVFELRYFFTGAIAGTGDIAEHSARSVRERIRKMISDEDPSRVLSDDAIVDSLKTQGIDIARRTVAKYRDAMNIPSSVQRRREKRAAAELNG